MLIPHADLDRIVAGEIQVLFRRWQRPTVKAGGTLKTAKGLLAIDAVKRVLLKDLTERDATKAGFESQAALLTELRARPDGQFYRIELHYAGADPRIALRVDVGGLDVVRVKLERLDRGSKWTRQFLTLIRDNEAVRAPELAERVGWQTAEFKTNVRKLKNLGLTESLKRGYRLSPRGRALLEEES